MSKIPEWAFSKALEACNISHGAGKFGAESIALALVEAERRGIEKAAKFHDDQADQFERAAFQELSVSRKLRNDTAAEQHRIVAAAIRHLSETDK